MQHVSRLPDVSLPTLMRQRIRVRGTVQGVGFRPFVFQLAQQLGLSGWVLNDAEGVLIEIEGSSLKGFLIKLETELPLLAHVTSIETAEIPPDGQIGFHVRDSVHGKAQTMVGADVCVCSDCLNEMFSASDRRHLYPFLNCTNCGPRYTITRAVPYDRTNTSMAAFDMCEDCAQEYHNPLDRRFHAQPTACPACGPKLSHSVKDILQVIRAGGIVALKGLGGFHLICDARDESAIARLRARKARDAKPFAVMVLNAESAKFFTSPTSVEDQLLISRERPIVLCERRLGTELAANIAPDLASLGVMLPYTPLHYLLFHEALAAPEGTGWLEKPCDHAFVVTSANLGGEPLVIGNEEASICLSQIADLIVDHDRDILIRNDDSVLRVIDGAPAFIRRARGFAPQPIQIGEDIPNVLALGGHLKSTICVTRGREAFLSQHIGDVDNVASFSFLQETVEHLLSTLDVQPEAVACDMHPDFLSSMLASELGLPVIRVQHHHAHCASVLAEHQITSPALGLALDGYGYGADAAAWGGELLRLEGADYQRIGQLATLSAPGGDKAAREPWRLALALLEQFDRSDLTDQRYGERPLTEGLRSIVKSGHAPETSSCGRYFDLAAALLGVCDLNRYEGEAAMKLEALVRVPALGQNLWQVRNGILDISALCDRLIELSETNAPSREGAELFHGTLIDGLTELVSQAAETTGLRQVALSGGCFLNRILSEGLTQALKDKHITPFFQRQAPPNDGGLSLGQALIAGRVLKAETNSCA